MYKGILSLLAVVVVLYGCSSAPIEPPPSPLVAKLKREAIDGWSVSCSIDRYADERVCQAGAFGKTCDSCSGSLPVIVRMTDAGADVSIGFHTHPGAIGKVRINDNPVEYFDSARIYGPVAQRVIEQMQSGGRGLATSVAWPNKYTEFSFDLSGFPAAHERLLREWQSVSQ